eukprot:1684348-Rhodomonas_salina.2
MLKDGAIAVTSGSELKTLAFSSPWYGRLSSRLILGYWGPSLGPALRVVTGLLLVVTDTSCK